MAKHPTTRADRRHVRRITIKAAHIVEQSTHWHWPRCYCWPLGYSYSHAYSDHCAIHGPDTVDERRRIGRYAKTGPVNWYKDCERDWFTGGVVRRDYRAGGGNRSIAKEWGNHIRGAGRFYLPTALSEWTPWDEWDEDAIECLSLPLSQTSDDGELQVEVPLFQPHQVQACSPESAQ